MHWEGVELVTYLDIRVLVLGLDRARGLGCGFIVASYNRPVVSQPHIEHGHNEGFLKLALGVVSCDVW